MNTENGDDFNHSPQDLQSTTDITTKKGAAGWFIY